MKLKLLLLLSVLIPGLSFADQVASASFKGINNNENSVVIDPAEAQDLLNVDVTPGGKTFKKRSGYGTYKALATAKPIHGGFHSFDSTGNDVQIWGSSTSLYGIVADATPTQLISSATINSTWDCVDSQGSSYCVDSSHDAYIKTNGATMSWFTSPAGTMIESTPDRIVVSGVSASPNTLFVSQSNTFTNFVVGVNATDAFNEVIAAPGSKITHIRWGCGKLLWWKDQSFGYFDFDDQFTAQVKIVSPTIGTFDNTSALDPGGRIWFRGQDGHTWMYDCSSLVKQSIDITPNVQASGKRTSNFWQQTSQSDWQSGSIVPSVNLSTVLSVGDVIVSSFQAVENSSAQWTSGFVSNMTVNPSSITININSSGNLTNADFENPLSGNWTRSQNFTNSWTTSTAAGLSCGTLNPQSGSKFLSANIGGTATHTSDFQSIDLNSATLQTVSIPHNGCTTSWTQLTLTPTSANFGKRVRFRFHINDSFNGDTYFTTTDSYVWGGGITFYYVDLSDGVSNLLFLDNVQEGSSTITSGSFTSQAYNTSFTSPTYQISGFNWTANTSTPTFSIQTTTDTATGQWATLLTSSATNAVGNQYVRWVSTISIGSGDNALTAISSITIIAKSTGTFYSAVKNAPNITGWSTFGANTILSGGTEAFFIRASSAQFTVLSSTPNWASQSVGALVSYATGTYMQVRDDFAVTAATQNPTLNDFTINWFEGSATDQAYMLYFDNAIWESVAFGSGQSTNNYVFKYDLINQGWTLYNFGVGGLLVQANTLYFGDTSAGNIFNYGTATSDNGTAINAFWKSKDYSGADPFLQNALSNIDSFAKKNAGATLTVSYATDTSTTTSYSMNLSTSNAIVQSRKLLPAGKLGYVFNIQYGDTSASSAWEFLGYRIGFTQQPYRPTY